jgi:Zn-dependent peptidase ImmA (M78 family)
MYIYIAEELMADESPRGYGRYRMTVAEELAHIHLHRQVIEQIDSPDGFRELHNHKQWGDVERDAKRYAAALLMPGQRLSASAERVYAGHASPPRRVADEDL